MKTVIYLIVIIGWGILQARRKAMREQKRKEAAQSRAEAPPQTRQRTSVPLGPVSAEENRPIYQAQQSQVPSQPPDYDRTRSYSQQVEPPKEIQPLLDSMKRRKAKKQEQQNDEQVEEIVQPVVMGPDAYDQVATVRRSISFDPDSLRTFVVTREVLGPPRAKRPHRPGVRQR
jgi:hypothetical protein